MVVVVVIVVVVVVVVNVVMLNNDCNITGSRTPPQLYYKVGKSLLNHQNPSVLIMTS